jgi:ATP-dependent RNA helicase DDX52/ROK1
MLCLCTYRLWQDTGFLAPDTYENQGSKGAVKAVILCPTRELAAQTTRECKKFAKGRKFSIKLVTKDLSQDGNFKDMHCDILVSTPLRLNHAIKKRDLDLSRYVIIL